jgi:hypothetical protein
MSGPASQLQWYLARDGKQHGPISDAELTTFIEQGHLQPSDLLWREGFAEWQPAMVVFPQRGPPASRPRPAQQRSAAGSATERHPAAEDRSYRGDQADGGGRFSLGRVAAVVVVVAVLVGAGGLAYAYRGHLAELVRSMTAPTGAMAVADRKSLEAPPLAGFRGGTVDTIDANLQATALWPVIKREFPDWYLQRLGEAAALARDGKDDAAIGQHMAKKLRELRRQQVVNGLSATQPLLKTVATAFFDNLTRLRGHSAQACHGLIDGGEANPAVVALLQGSEFTPGLQAQLTVMFEAIAEGRRQPRVYPRPSQAEFQLLASDLVKMGWTQADMVLFNDEKALAKAPPERVCQLVHDFFKAQIEFQDPEVRMKLIINALRPVFAG